MVPGPRAIRDNKALAQFPGVSNTQNSFVAESAGLVSLLGRPEIEGMSILSSGYPISWNINDSGNIRYLVQGGEGGGYLGTDKGHHSEGH